MPGKTRQPKPALALIFSSGPATLKLIKQRSELPHPDIQAIQPSARAADRPGIRNLIQTRALETCPGPEEPYARSTSPAAENMVAYSLNCTYPEHLSLSNQLYILKYNFKL
jgi:hypothetical protein